MIKNNKKKFFYTKKSRFLMAGFGAFVFSLSCSITATYAWYTLKEQYRADHLNISFSSTETSLHLGIRDENGEIVFKDEYTHDELGFGDTKLDEVSGMYSDEWLNDSSVQSDEKVPLFRANYRGNIDHRATRYATGGYIQKEFFLRASQDCSLYLSDDTSFVPNLDANKAAAKDYNLDEDALNEVVNAVRISFYTGDNYVILNPGESEETYYGGLLDLNLDGYYDYDSSTNKEIIYGQIDGEVNYKSAISSSSPLENNKNTFMGNHKDGIELVDLENPTYTIQKENSVTLDQIILDSEQPSTTNDPLCIMHKDEIKRVVVSIYLEGWDLHMIDSLHYASFDASINFAALFNI